MSRCKHHNGVKQASGFTLLEMVIVLGMLAVFATWFVMSITTVETEQRLREASGGIESLVRRARNIAVRQQRPYELTIREGEISIAPKYVLDDEEEDEEFDEDHPRVEFENITASEKTDPKVSYEIKRWRSDKWVKIKGDEKVVVSLEPIGLVEPISIRCSIGESWLIQELHPLTGSVRDEQMSVEKE